MPMKADLRENGSGTSTSSREETMRASHAPDMKVRQPMAGPRGRRVGAALLLAAATVAAAMAAEPPKPPAATTAASEPKPAPPADSAAVPDKSSIPESDRRRKNPVPNVPEARESGKRTFNGNCARCHGPLGDGTGEVSRKMHWTIPNLSSAEVQARWTDGELFYILGHGHGAMPSHKLTDEKKWEVILHVRTLPTSAPARPKP